MKVEAVLTLPEAAALSTLELKSSQETEEVTILHFTTIYNRATFFFCCQGFYYSSPAASMLANFYFIFRQCARVILH